MIAQELLRRQRELSPREDLAPYAEQWVVLRSGYVLAHDEDLGALMAGRVLGQLDVIVRVGDPSSAVKF